ncbi:LytTR family DNA-binding domain-containing protein [Novosphingobium beihaiensis]|uniref:LytTR family transcriptional regulator n=1 Tax=Novosphingobium beihaiensis TaxID=2930389 RepID=A0ABT0BT26_9SPHN|nr:LytTR family DNA-binding domain-containing protein [Novosphingobium beihaiensis]MCJ2188215.1 LytTR family transcriptional regulator [Novosphingobium beihaiensis]
MTGAAWRHEGIRDAAMLAVVIAVLALFGPFGTYADPFLTRLLSWGVFVLGGFICFRPVIAGGDALSRMTRLPRGLTITLACLLASFPVTLLVALWQAGERWAGMRLGGLVQLYPYVLVVGFMITALQIVLRRASADVATGGPAGVQDSGANSVQTGEEAAMVPAPEPAANALLDRLPPELGRDVLCVRNEDHYVRVFTQHGDALLLFRLSDAVAALHHVEGAQVHRSCWVARAAVADVLREGRNVTLVLTNGEQVRVARAMLAPLRSEGWF